MEVLFDSDCTPLSSWVDFMLQEFRNGNTNVPLHSIVSVMASACGVSDVEVKPEDVSAAVDIAAVLENLYASAKDSSDYLLVNKNPQYKRFPQRFADMWRFLVTSAFNSGILFHDAFLPAIAQWMTAMSESKSRPFRHTATVGVLSIIESLNQMSSNVKSRLSFSREAAELAELQRSAEQVQEWRDHLFSQTVHQRLRDVAPQIRLACVQQLSSWTLHFPDVFMENKYLRYFGMPLHDQVASLRAAALDMLLQGLGKLDGAYDRMKLFIEYFIKRIVEMSSDVDAKCVELSLRLMAMIVRCCAEGHHEDILSSEMIDAALRSLFDERRGVRIAAGVLLNVFVHSRCAADGGDESENCKMAAELIAIFTDTLRTQYKEEMPEKYIVDALWGTVLPPAVLTETRVFIDMANSDTADEVVVGVGFLAATLQKARGTLLLGPVSKDERRASTKKLPPAKQQIIDDLTLTLSIRATEIAVHGMKRFPFDLKVQYSLAELIHSIDLTCFESADQRALSDMMKELKRITMSSLAFPEPHLDLLINVWHRLTEVDYPLRSEAAAYLQEMLQAVKQQLISAEKPKGKQKSEHLILAGRCYFITSLVPTSELLSLLETVFSWYTSTSITSEPLVTYFALSSIFHSTLFEVKPSMDDNAVLKETVGRVALQCLSVCEGWREASCPELRVALLTRWMDLVCLGLCEMSEELEKRFTSVFEDVLGEVNNGWKAANESQKEAAKASADPVSDFHALLHTSRSAVYQSEALGVRLARGAGRLLLLNRVKPSLAPTFLFVLSQSPSKHVSAYFKKLFYTLRERSGDSFALERDTVTEGYQRCVAVGATPLSVEAMVHVGTKLSLMHFTLANDRYYSACISMVQFGIDFASSVDPLMLLPILPYCSKLKQAEALHLVRHVLPSHEIFKAAANPHVCQFITALCRVAKIADPVTPVDAPQRKRRRELDGRQPSEGEVGDQALEEIVETLANSYSNRAAAVVPRVVTDDGWHVRRGETIPGSQNDESETATSLRRPIVNLPSTQESIATITGSEDGTEEEFISPSDYH